MLDTMRGHRPQLVPFLVAMALVGILISGCTPAPPQNEKEPVQVQTAAPANAEGAVTTSEQHVTQAPANETPAERILEKPTKTIEVTQPTTAVVSTDPSNILKEIETCHDLIALQEMVDEMRALGEIAPEISAKIDETRNALQSEAKVYRVSDVLDLVAFRWTNVDTDKYQFSWLFEVKRPIAHDCLIYVYARTDKSHWHLVENNPDYRRNGLLNWTLDLKECPPSSQWKPGTYVLAKSRVLQDTKEIPYNISFNLFYNDEDGKGHQYGDMIELGWVADLRE